MVTMTVFCDSSFGGRAYSTEPRRIHDVGGGETARRRRADAMASALRAQAAHRERASQPWPRCPYTGLCCEVQIPTAAPHDSLHRDVSNGASGWLTAVRAPTEPGTTVNSVKPDLSAREQEVLIAWLRTDSKVAVGQALFISLSTVRTHIQRIREKYEAVGRPASTKAALTARAIQDGFIKVGDL
jgi:DNA-binding CsgD family transcriptional regulator